MQPVQGHLTGGAAIAPQPVQIGDGHQQLGAIMELQRQPFLLADAAQPGQAAHAVLLMHQDVG